MALIEAAMAAALACACAALAWAFCCELLRQRGRVRAWLVLGLELGLGGVVQL